MGFYILSLLIGIGLGYIIFYFKYEHKDSIDELRSNLKEANKEIHMMNNELDEYIQQNTILKEKTTELLEKNDDLSDIVSELSKYYFHIKKAAEKTTELSKFLHNPDIKIEEKIEIYQNNTPKTNELDSDKSFF